MTFTLGDNSGVTRAHIGPAVIVTSAKALGGLSLLALNIWVAQYLSPALYGVFALASTGVLLLEGMVGSALDAAVIGSIHRAPGAQPTGAERAGVVLKVGAGAIASVGIPTALWITVGPPAALIAAVACLGGLGLLLHRSVLVYFQIRERFGWYGAADLAHTVARWAGVAIVLGAGYASAVAAIGAYALAAWGVAAVGALVIAPAWTARRAPISADEFGAVTRTAWTAVATTGVGALVARLDILVLGLVSPAEAGILAAASTVALAPMWLGAYLAPAFTGRILPYCREQRLRSLFRDVQGGLLALALLGTAIGIMAAPLVVGRLLPPAYAATGPVVPVLLAAGAAGFFTFPLVLHTLLFLSPRTYLAMDLISLPFLCVFYVVAGRRAGALGVAWVTAVSAVLKACIAHLSASVAIHREEARCAGSSGLARVSVTR